MITTSSRISIGFALVALLASCQATDGDRIGEGSATDGDPLGVAGHGRLGITSSAAETAGSALDPALEVGPGPSGCPDSLCGSDRTELPRSAPPRSGAPVTVVPEPPRIERRLRMSEPSNPACNSTNAATGDDCVGRRLGPVLPAFRTSTDGRIALTGDAITARVSVSMLDGFPTRPLIRRGVGLEAFSPDVPIEILSDDARRRPSGDRFLCGANQAPKPNQDRDCYDLTMIEDWQDDEACGGACGRYASIPIRVCVANPKSPDARVVVARTNGPWTVAQRYPAHTNEQIVTADGRLVVFRLIGSGSDESEVQGVGMPFGFRRADGNVQPTAVYSLAYSYSANPCDVQAWFAHTGDFYENLRPLSSAHYDTRLAAYGFAAYPLRDAYGVPFVEGDLVRGSYPWIDRDGNNMVFSTIRPSMRVGQTDVRRYPTAKQYPGASDTENRSPRGFAIAGSWTQGKMVMLDNLLNNEDYGFDAGDTRLLGLYKTASGVSIAARVDGNSNTRAYATGGVRFERGNSQHIESLQNTFAMHSAMAPVTPRDVAWTFSRGDFLEEVAFDDMIDPHVVLLAPMDAAWRNARTISANEGPAAARAGIYRDGFSISDGQFVHNPAAIDLQNAATSPVYPMPTHGEVLGAARLEPIAQGGIEGRGMWLEGDAALSFPFPADHPLPDRTFYAGVFVDVRTALTGGRHVLGVRGANGTAHVVLHPGGVSVQNERTTGLEIGSYPVAADHPYRQRAGNAGSWHHVGVLFARSGEVTVLIDGDPIGAKTFSAPLTLGAGAVLTVGGAFGSIAGIRGWVDEARLVTSGAVSALEAPESIELLCNYARGTMSRVLDTDSDFALAERAPLTRARAEALGLTVPVDQRIRCVTNYTGDHRVSVADRGTRALRQLILHTLSGDGTLHVGMPRPDTQGNAFCTSCHIGRALDADRPTGLLTSALTFKAGVAVEDDPRTQPAQPWARRGQPAFAHGIIPQGWVTSIHGVSLPTSRRVLTDPYPVLSWVLRE
jgi:hypothetical protein